MQDQRFDYIDYGDGTAEVYSGDPAMAVVVLRVTPGDNAATTAYVTAGLLNDAVNSAYRAGVDDTLASLANQSLLLDGE